MTSAAGSALLEQVRQLCGRAAALTGDSGHDVAAQLRDRLDEPLRVAIAGRVKAGKSTLLNALVGERLAPTDAGECTRIVTWYRHGLSYEVTARHRDGSERPLRFTRAGGALDIDLGNLDPAEVDSLEVRWPSARLKRMTLIDTPGLGSLDDTRSQRARRLLGLEEDRASQVDAVLYLMRHLHTSDAEFLEAFTDPSLARPSPVNAVAVLSRADEIGAGRLDALDSAARIAERLAADDRIRPLCATVVTVAGLIAETGCSFREAEFATLKALLENPDADIDRMLLSVELFCTPEVSTPPPEVRRDLLLRLGMFGVRFCIEGMRAGTFQTASGVADALTAASGLERLVEVLDGKLGARSLVLKARSALRELHALAVALAEEDPAAADQLAAAIERIESGAHELAELRLLHLLLTGAVSLDPASEAEVTRLTQGGDPAARLGLAADTDVATEKQVALERLEAWRAREAHPLTDRPTAHASAIVAASYERLLGELESRAR